eukprot:CAMPEP_0183523564 /NCGR_PEP_ID=MMETSP0371-20130417/19261_1 /TAXON_ID=268820 /ORGANISM="Peridinium aciculiferum, Strain PAER-2" /LENGTH=162 /DNA_ID=CAMNT_0025722519 /DNA_START=63 /DNA_END=549 /DNA_ORIENTATION=+
MANTPHTHASCTESTHTKVIHQEDKLKDITYQRRIGTVDVSGLERISVQVIELHIAEVLIAWLQRWAALPNDQLPLAFPDGVARGHGGIYIPRPSEEDEVWWALLLTPEGGQDASPVQAGRHRGTVFWSMCRFLSRRRRSPTLWSMYVTTAAWSFSTAGHDV